MALSLLPATLSFLYIMAKMAAWPFVAICSEYKFLRVALKIGCWIFSFAVIYFLGRSILQHWQGLTLKDFSLDIKLLLASLTFFLSFYILYGLCWYSILKDLILPVKFVLPRLQLLYIFFNGLLVRYLPAGKIFNIGVRTELLVAVGVTRGLALKSLLLEQIYFIGSALLVLVSFGSVLTYPGQDRCLQVSISLAVVGGLIILLIVAFWSQTRICTQTFPLKHLFRRKSVGLWMKFIVANLLQGGAVLLLLSSLYPALASSDMELYWWGLVAYPVSRVVGQLVVVLPGGIGLRETTYVAFMTPFVPVEPLIITVTLARMISILFEIFLYLSLHVLSRKQKTPAGRKISDRSFL